MDWLCPDDRGRLAPREEALVECVACGRRYPLSEGSPVFAAETTWGRAPFVEELAELMARHSSGEAARIFCEKHHCSRHGSSADWRLFAPTRRDGWVLTIGAGFGDDALEVAESIGGVASIVAHPAHAGILRRRSREQGGEARPVAVMRELTRLPLADGSVEMIVLADAGISGFGITPRTLPAVAREWRRVLSPEGTLFVGLANTLRRLTGPGRALSSSSAAKEGESLDRRIRRSTGSGAGRGLRLRGTIRTISQSGFLPPAIYAPLPDEKQARMILPVEDPRIVRYFLHHLIRKNSILVRGAIALGDLSVRLGFFRALVPYHYLLFKRG